MRRKGEGVGGTGGTLGARAGGGKGRPRPGARGAGLEPPAARPRGYDPRTMGLLARLLGRDRPPVPITLYVRKPCKLCDEMRAELERSGLSGHYRLTVVDIDHEAPAQVRDDHGPFVPVLEIGGQVAFKTRIPPGQLKKRFKTLAALYHAELARGRAGA